MRTPPEAWAPESRLPVRRNLDEKGVSCDALYSVMHSESATGTRIPLLFSMAWFEEIPASIYQERRAEGTGGNPATVAYGPMLIGMMFNLMLYGVVLSQTYIYLTSYKKRDKLWIQILVLFLLVANTANSVFVSADVYIALVINYGSSTVTDNAPYLKDCTWLFITNPIITGVVGAACQVFFCWRVKVLTRSWVLSGIVVIISIVGMIGSIMFSAHLVHTPAFLSFTDFKQIVILWLVCACAADVAISGIMVWYLRKHKTGFERSDELVDRIIRVTVQTGIITSFAAFIDMIVYLVNPSALHLLFNVVLTKLYTCTMLSSLNSRGGWQYSGSNGGSNSQSGGNMVSTIGGSQGRNKRTAHGSINPTATHTRPEVFVHVEHMELQDTPSRRTFKVGDDDSRSEGEWDTKVTNNIV
ncbi:hypothetical protein CYLTODRAFT_434209 [Cylindrobasidium torrendii FP15055 ss-10]|uniref:DUF6534 domain-containing protein n=1 Tax=Cylindrobasidium torrendii FP15055 ss-10 TaxID=1314674 RepID=A0A0D7BT15_9AGAR|nr:hypothetical protein CYLTODRAFT_434209 [Cylindrobasidium torrendii FP15055 ss-10]